MLASSNVLNLLGLRVCSIARKFSDPLKDSRLDELELSLGIKFNDRSLLVQATVHPSYLNESSKLGIIDYERLEYLGDAFLGWVVALELYRSFPAYTEGQLTRARSLLVDRRNLNHVANDNELGKYLYLGHGEENTGGRKRQSNLASVVESIIGAVLLDHGTDEARKLILRWLGQAIMDLNVKGIPQDSKSAFQEWAQAEAFGLPVYRIVKEEGPSNARRFYVEVLIRNTVWGVGDATRKIDAEQMAAAEALKRIDVYDDSPIYRA